MYSGVGLREAYIKHGFNPNRIKSQIEKMLYKADAHKFLNKKFENSEANIKVSRKEIMSKGRKRDIVKVRHIIIHKLKYEFDGYLTLKEIGALMGGLDHGTVIHAIEVIEHELKVYPEILEIYNKI